MKTAKAISLVAAMALGAAAITFAACDDSNDSNAVKEPSPGAGPTSSGGSNGRTSTPTSSGGTSSGDGGPTDCVQNPKTHLEIINACTNATKFTKNPTLTKLLPDGGLPPLQ